MIWNKDKSKLEKEKGKKTSEGITVKISKGEEFKVNLMPERNAEESIGNCSEMRM